MPNVFKKWFKNPMLVTYFIIHKTKWVQHTKMAANFHELSVYSLLLLEYCGALRNPHHVYIT